MSFQLMDWASKQTTGSPTRKAVLMALANATNHHTGQCNPSVDIIATETELGERAVRTALADLAKAGLIERSRNRRGDGSLGTYTYTFPLVGETHVGAQPEAPRAGRPAARGAAQEEPGTSEPGTTTDVVVAQSQDPPKLVLVDRQNLPMNALADVCGVNTSGGRVRELAAALNGPHGIRAQFWREEADRIPPGRFEVLLCEAIRRRAGEYRSKMPAGTLLTPLALAKWWSDLPAMGGGKLSPQDVFDIAQAEYDRIRGTG